MGGIEAVVRLLLSVDPALLPPLAAIAAASSTDASTEESSTGTGTSTSTSSEAIDPDAAALPADSPSEGSENVDGVAEGEAAAVDIKEEKGGDDNPTPAPPSSTDEPTQEQLQHQLAHLVVQGLWICTGGRAVTADRLKLGTVAVIEHVATLFESDRTDTQTKECCVAFLACLVRNDRQFVPVVLATRARTTLVRAFMEATPDTNPALLARLTFALTPLLGHTADSTQLLSLSFL
jgi:hypothetical protein